MLNKLVSSSRLLLLFPFAFLLITSCSVQQQIQKSAQEEVLANTALKTAHVGISIFDPAANKYLYNYQGDKYFVPASNTKIPTCYAAMKYLGDSLVGLRYKVYKGQDGKDTGIIIDSNGDPTFLHHEFKLQPVYDFLKNTKLNIGVFNPFVTNLAYNPGWPIGDLNESYMPPRSNFPIYGNVVKVFADKEGYNVIPHYFLKKDIIHFHLGSFSYAERYNDKNIFDIFVDTTAPNYQKSLPIFLNKEFPWYLIEDTLGKSIDKFPNSRFGGNMFLNLSAYEHSSFIVDTFNFQVKLIDAISIHSQPTDSLLKPMMHRSDNFFAEQSLLMVSNELLGVMNDEKIIDSLLRTDFKDLPQQPRWADGSGLSRYNLFTPQDLVFILNKMKNEFGMERIKEIFPTGGEGTISNYYKKDAGFIYGKTGTLSGVVAFSGFLYTKKGKLLLFSTLVNNHTGSATDVRRAIEKFLMGIRTRY